MKFDEYYLKENETEILRIPVNDFIFVKRSIDMALKDVLSGRKSKTYESIEVWKVKDKYLVVDGWHRFVDQLNRGKKIIKAAVVGEGYSDYYRTEFEDDEVYTENPFKRNANEV